MSKVFQRVKDKLRRNSRVENLPPGSFPNNFGGSPKIGTIRPPAKIDDDDDYDDNEQLGKYNIPEQTRAKEQQRGPLPNEGAYGRGSPYQPNNMNAPSAPFRPTSTGFDSGFPISTNPNIRPPNRKPSVTPGAASNPFRPFGPQSSGPTRPSFNPSSTAPTTTSGFPPGMNPNPRNPTPASNPTGFPGSSQPGTGFIPSASTSGPNPRFPGGVPPRMNFNPTSPTPAPNPQLPTGGSSPGMNPNQTVRPPLTQPPSTTSGFPPGMNPNRSSSPPTTNPPSSTSGFPPGILSNQTTSDPKTNPVKPTTDLPPSVKPDQKPNQSTIPSTSNSPSPTRSSPTDMHLSPPPPISTSKPSVPTSSFSPDMNINPPTPTSQRKPTLPVRSFSPDINLQPPPPPKVPPPRDANNPVNMPRKPIIKQAPLSHYPSNDDDNDDDDDNVSRLELDFPIENVLVDADIPSTMAIKINEAVEKDRLGHAYHVNRYTYEPPVQRISLGNDQRITRRLIDDTPRRGTRYISEIRNDDPGLLMDERGYHRKPKRHSYVYDPYYDDQVLDRYLDRVLSPSESLVIHAQNYDNFQDNLSRHAVQNRRSMIESTMEPLIVDTNMMKEPFFYYTARALPEDPMQYY